MPCVFKLVHTLLALPGVTDREAGRQIVIFPERLSPVQCPAFVVVVHHQMAHAAVYGQVDAIDEAVPVITEEEYGTHDVFRFTHSSRRVLLQVGRRIGGDGSLGVETGRLNPAGCYGVDAGYTGQADGQGVGQGRDTALGSRVAFRVGL